jgi:hypothetical protein
MDIAGNPKRIRALLRGMGITPLFKLSSMVVRYTGPPHIGKRAQGVMAMGILIHNQR